MAKISSKNGIILVGGYNLSTHAADYTVDHTVAPLEVTGFTDGWQNYIPGPYNGQMAINFYWDSAAGMSTDYLITLPTGTCVSVLPEGYTLGNYALSMKAMQSNFTPGGAAAGVLMAGNIVFQTNGVDYGPVACQALAHATITDTTTGTGFVDDAAAQVTQRCAGFLHVWDATATDTYVVKIQHSNAIGGAYADLVTFTLNGTALGSERVAVASGAIEQYRRVLATRTGAAGDSFGFTVTFWHAGM